MKLACTIVYASFCIPKNIKSIYVYYYSFFCIKLIHVYCFVFNMHYFNITKTWHGIAVSQFFRIIYQWDRLRVMWVLKNGKTPCSVPVLSEKKNEKKQKKVGFFCEKIKKIGHSNCSVPVFSNKLPMRLIACNVSF